MTIPRRRILRPAATLGPRRPQDRKTQTLRSRLDKERTALSRWMTRLRRAFHAMEKTQGRIGRIERKISHLEK